MTDFENIGHPLLGKILTGEANSKEQKDFAGWLKQDVKNQREFERIKRLWGFARNKQDYDLGAAHSRIQKKIAAQIKPAGKLYRIFRKIAAILILPILIASIYWVPDLFRTVINQEVAIKTIRCPLGQTMELGLPDGSRVYLNAGSQISYPLRFDGCQYKREVFLNGEALFNVVKDKEHPFIVNLGKVNIRVLGTIFNVSNYSDDPKTEIFLKKGAIELISPDNQSPQFNRTKMAPNQLARMTANGQLLELIEADPDSYGVWKDGVLTFNDDSMEDVVRKLIRKYDVPIHFPEAKNIDSRINGSFKNKTIEEVLEILKYTTSISYQVNHTDDEMKKHIIITPMKKN